MNDSSSAKEEKTNLICVGLDQHANSITAVVQENACLPKPARRFKDIQSLYHWLEQLQSEDTRIAACYEAGPCGFWLYRKLIDMGIECIVVAPRKWSENGKVKTDARDAKVLCERLFHWVSGKHNVFTIVRVPSRAEEHRRELSRTRESLIKERKRNAQRGRGIGLTNQMRLKGQWWKGDTWVKQASALGHVLGPIRQVLLCIEREIEKLTRDLEKIAAPKTDRPAGLGALSDAIVSCEVCDFTRFKNRKQPGHFAGLTPGEDSSGSRRRQLSITKTGSSTLRRVLVEAVWRLMRFQPNWWAWKKWQPKWEDIPKWRRKQIVVALARQLLIDLWRLRTGQTTMEKLGWTPAP